MATVAVSSSIRDQAEAMIVRQLGRGFSPETRLETLGTLAAVQLMLTLELQFDILLDVDEVLPDGTLGGLVGLVILRVRTAPLHSSPHVDGTLIDLAARRAERARRAQAEFGIPSPPPQLVALPPQPVDFPQRRALRTVLGMAAACALGGAAGGVAAFFGLL